MAPFVGALLGIDTNPAHGASSDLNADGTPDEADIQSMVNILVGP